jgi:hypothetical protein
MLRVDFVLRRELTMLTQTAGNASKAQNSEEIGFRG